MTHPSVVWAIAGILLIASEMLIPGFTIFFFGLGALITALILFPAPELGVGSQIALWALVSIGSFVLLRKYFRSVLKGTVIYRDTGADKYAGREAIVQEPVSPEQPGRVRFNGTGWEAVSSEGSFKPGEKVMILRREGLTFIVSRPDTGPDTSYSKE